MEKKTKPILLGIVLCFFLGSLFFIFQSCKRDRASADQPESFGMSSDDCYPSWSPDGKKIVFASIRDVNSKIYVMNADGSDLTQLTDYPAFDRDPTWSPDGSKIAFYTNRDGNIEIYIMNTDGSKETRLTDNPATDCRPSWSPDESKIVFESGRGGNRDIYIMNADGSNQTRLTDNPARDGWPTWSPDGTKIALDSNRDGNREIYIMNVDGSNQTRLTDNPSDDCFPAWSPDGRRIVFSSDRDGNLKIFTMNADGSNQTRLTDGPGNDYIACWSPDGQKIAFVSDRDFAEQLYIMNADGSNLIRLTKNAAVNKTAGLSPVPQSELNLDEIPYPILIESFRETDGKENWEICIIDANGSNFINLTNTSDIGEMYPRISPDGRRICFVVDEGEDLKSKRRNVYIMNRDGTDRVKIAENAYQQCWSPDGKFIAYLPGEYPRYNPNMTANRGIEIYDLEAKKAKRHPNDKIFGIFCLCWSPDGEWFVSADGIGIPPGYENAFKVEDKTMMRLSMDGCTPDISPDGNFLVWNKTDWNFNIGALNLDQRQHNLTDHKIVVACERDHWVYHADWSPDGNYLAFSYSPEEGRHRVSYPAPGSNICVCDLSTGKWTLVTTDGKSNKEPDWIPVREGK